MDELTGAEALLRTLRRMGVEKFSASPGSDWAPLWEALAKLSYREDIPQYLSSRHEETAIAMASGYTKATGKLSAVWSTRPSARCTRPWPCARRCTSASPWWC